MKIYKIDNGYLLPVDLDEKQLKERKKKYFFYEKDDFLIFNFDYNKIKPFVLSILKKKKYLEDINKKLLAIVGIMLASTFFISYYYLNQIKGEYKKTKEEIQAILSWKIIKIEKEKIKPIKVKEIKLEEIKKENLKDNQK